MAPKHIVFYYLGEESTGQVISLGARCDNAV